MEKETSHLTFLGKNTLHPYQQAFTILILIIISGAIISGTAAKKNEEWYFASTLLLFFTVANPILGVFKIKWKQYVLRSLMGYAVLFPASIILTNLWAHQHIAALQPFQMLFAATFLFYFITIFLVGLFRFILRLIKTADNNPKYQ